MNQAPDLQDYLNQAMRAAREARELIRGHYRAALEVEMKADRTPVTEADRQAELLIREILMEHFPEHGFYGEEHERLRPEAACQWLVDPIDGTKSFVRGYGFFSTQIALMIDGELVLGVSCAPVMDETAWAMRGRGAWLNADPVKVSGCRDLAEATVSIGNVRGLAASEAGWRGLGRVMAGCNRTRGYGDFYHYHRLAAGQIDVVIESELNLLDIAALAVIIEAAGGCISDLDGQPIGVGTRSVLASASEDLHQQMLEQIGGQPPALA